MAKTRVLIIDDHNVVLEGVKTALGRHNDVEVVGVGANGRDAVKMVENLNPQIVIMDIAMPHFNGIEATFQIKKMDPGIKVIIFTMHSYKEFLVDLMRAGISAYVLKQNPISDLYLAIQVVKRGGTYLSEDASEFWANHAENLVSGKEEKNQFDLLSLREREVFQLLAEGLSIKEAADMLTISPKTVETHKYHIMEKLQIRTMTDWTKEAIRRGIINL
jgi:two-component system response regulator NreC